MKDSLGKIAAVFAVVGFIGLIVWSFTRDTVRISIINLDVNNQTVDVRARISIDGSYEKDLIMEEVREGEVSKAKETMKQKGKEYIVKYNELKRLK